MDLRGFQENPRKFQRRFNAALRGLHDLLCEGQFRRQFVPGEFRELKGLFKGFQGVSVDFREILLSLRKDYEDLRKIFRVISADSRGLS